MNILSLGTDVGCLRWRIMEVFHLHMVSRSIGLERATYNALREVFIFRFSEFLASQEGSKSVNT